MKNNLENDNILSNKIIEAIDIILKNTPNAVFGGSIALCAVGLLNRRINDIDLFFSIGESLSLNNFLTYVDEIGSDTVTNVNGDEIQRTSAKIKNIKICCFKVSEAETQHSLFSFLGRTIKIQNVNYAIQAKLAYINNSKKNKILVSPTNNNKNDVDTFEDFLEEKRLQNNTRSNTVSPIPNDEFGKKHIEDMKMIWTGLKYQE
jgi:hypothetical protein